MNNHKTAYLTVKNSAKSQYTLTVRQLALLAAIYDDGVEASVDYYARTLNLSKPAVTKALNRLEELELLKRKPNINDGRKVIIASTPTGFDYIHQLEAEPSLNAV